MIYHFYKFLGGSVVCTLGLLEAHFLTWRQSPKPSFFSAFWHFGEPVLPPSLLPVSSTLEIHLKKLFHLYPWPVLSLWPMNPHQPQSPDGWRGGFKSLELHSEIIPWMKRRWTKELKKKYTQTQTNSFSLFLHAHWSLKTRQIGEEVGLPSVYPGLWNIC